MYERYISIPHHEKIPFKSRTHRHLQNDLQRHRNSSHPFYVHVNQNPIANQSNFLITKKMLIESRHNMSKECIIINNHMTT